MAKVARGLKWLTLSCNLDSPGCLGSAACRFFSRELGHPKQGQPCTISSRGPPKGTSQWNACGGRYAKIEAHQAPKLVWYTSLARGPRGLSGCQSKPRASKASQWTFLPKDSILHPHIARADLKDGYHTLRSIRMSDDYSVTGPHGNLIVAFTPYLTYPWTHLLYGVGSLKVRIGVFVYSPSYSFCEPYMREDIGAVVQ